MAMLSIKCSICGARIADEINRKFSATPLLQKFGWTRAPYGFLCDVCSAGGTPGRPQALKRRTEANGAEHIPRKLKTVEFY